MKGIEKRASSRRAIKLEPAAEGRPARLTGYAATFNTISEIMFDDEGKPFREVISPGAFTRSLERNDIRALAHHEETKLLGRTGSGTLRLVEDDTGLAYDCDLPPVTYAADLSILVDREDIDGCSFGFHPGDVEDEFTTGEDGLPLRRLIRVNVAEVTLGTVWPAYTGTSINLRSRGAIPAPAVEDDDQAGPDRSKTTHRLANARRHLRRLEL